MFTFAPSTIAALLGLGIALSSLSGCMHAPMFNGSAQRDCVEHALQGSATVEDARLAKELLERACSVEDAGACAVLGVLHEHGRSGRVDLAKAQRAYDRACTLGDVRGCAHTSRLLMRSSDPTLREDSARALSMYCERGETVACAALADALPPGATSAASAGKAMGVLWRACDAGDATACLGIGDRFHEQAGQEAVAREHWLRACALGSDEGCRRHLQRAATTAVARAD